jgi:hypothetical protein
MFAGSPMFTMLKRLKNSRKQMLLSCEASQKTACYQRTAAPCRKVHVSKYCP